MDRYVIENDIEHFHRKSIPIYCSLVTVEVL